MKIQQKNARSARQNIAVNQTIIAGKPARKLVTNVKQKKSH